MRKLQPHRCALLCAMAAALLWVVAAVDALEVGDSHG